MMTSSLSLEEQLKERFKDAVMVSTPCDKTVHVHSTTVIKIENDKEYCICINESITDRDRQRHQTIGSQNNGHFQNNLCNFLGNILGNSMITASNASSSNTGFTNAAAAAAAAVASQQQMKSSSTSTSYSSQANANSFTNPFFSGNSLPSSSSPSDPINNNNNNNGGGTNNFSMNLANNSNLSDIFNLMMNGVKQQQQQQQQQHATNANSYSSTTTPSVNTKNALLDPSAVMYNALFGINPNFISTFNMTQSQQQQQQQQPNNVATAALAAVMASTSNNNNCNTTITNSSINSINNPFSVDVKSNSTTQSSSHHPSSSIIDCSLVDLQKQSHQQQQHNHSLESNESNTEIFPPIPPPIPTAAPSSKRRKTYRPTRLPNEAQGTIAISHLLPPDDQLINNNNNEGNNVENCENSIGTINNIVEQSNYFSSSSTTEATTKMIQDLLFTRNPNRQVKEEPLNINFMNNTLQASSSTDSGLTSFLSTFNNSSLTTSATGVGSGGGGGGGGGKKRKQFPSSLPGGTTISAASNAIGNGANSDHSLDTVVGGGGRTNQHNNESGTCLNENVSTVSKKVSSCKTFRCNQCKRIYPSLNSLCEHTFEEHGSFKCTVCDSKFTQRSNLQRHALKHVGFKPFECVVCKKAYYRKDHSIRHVEVTHPQFDPKTSIKCHLTSSQCLDYLEEMEKMGTLKMLGVRGNGISREGGGGGTGGGGAGAGAGRRLTLKDNKTNTIATIAGDASTPSSNPETSGPNDELLQEEIEDIDFDGDLEEEEEFNQLHHHHLHHHHDSHDMEADDNNMTTTTMTTTTSDAQILNNHEQEDDGNDLPNLLIDDEEAHNANLLHQVNHD